MNGPFNGYARNFCARLDRFAAAAQLEIAGGIIQNIRRSELQRFRFLTQQLWIAKIVAQVAGAQIEFVVEKQRKEVAHHFPIPRASRSENELGAFTDKLTAIAITHTTATAQGPDGISVNPFDIGNTGEVPG